MTGHTMINCFKIYGYPDWYKSLKNKKGLHEQGVNHTTMRANSVGTSLNTPFDCVNDQETIPELIGGDISHNSVDLTTIIQREIAKYLHGKSNGAQAHVAQTSFACITSNPIHSCNLYTSTVSGRDYWIVDTGASNHMCYDISLLIDIESIDPPLPVFFFFFFEEHC